LFGRGYPLSRLRVPGFMDNPRGASLHPGPENRKNLGDQFTERTDQRRRRGGSGDSRNWPSVNSRAPDRHYRAQDNQSHSTQNRIGKYQVYRTKVENLITAGRWNAVERVRNEIGHVGSPALKAWATAHRGQFIKHDAWTRCSTGEARGGSHCRASPNISTGYHWHSRASCVRQNGRTVYLSACLCAWDRTANSDEDEKGYKLENR
jgi:hypothetical protein